MTLYRAILKDQAITDSMIILLVEFYEKHSSTIIAHMAVTGKA